MLIQVPRSFGPWVPGSWSSGPLNTVTCWFRFSHGVSMFGDLVLRLPKYAVYFTAVGMWLLSYRIDHRSPHCVHREYNYGNSCIIYNMCVVLGQILAHPLCLFLILKPKIFAQNSYCSFFKSKLPNNFINYSFTVNWSSYIDLPHILVP